MKRKYLYKQDKRKTNVHSPLLSLSLSLAVFLYVSPLLFLSLSLSSSLPLTHTLSYLPSTLTWDDEIFHAADKAVRPAKESRGIGRRIRAACTGRVEMHADEIQRNIFDSVVGAIEKVRNPSRVCAANTHKLQAVSGVGHGLDGGNYNIVVVCVPLLCVSSGESTRCKEKVKREERERVSE